MPSIFRENALCLKLMVLQISNGGGWTDSNIQHDIYLNSSTEWAAKAVSDTVLVITVEYRGKRSFLSRYNILLHY